MYALHGHRFSRVFGRYVMAIFTFVFVLTSSVHSARGQTPRANYGRVHDSQADDQIYFARTDDGVSVDSVLAHSDALAKPIAEGEIEPGSIESSSIHESPAETLYDSMTFYFNGGTCDSTGCNSPGCDRTTACSICGQHACGNCRSWELFQNCTPPGMLQWMKARHDHGNACWTGRADAVMLWRSAPYSRELVRTGPVAGGTPVLNANQLESGMAAGPRIQLFRKNACGNAIEFGYLGAWNFQSEKLLRGTAPAAFAADLLGNSASFQDGDVNLTSHIQTLELNSRTPMFAGNVQFICGVRWLEWAESFSLDTQTPGPGFTDNWSSRTVNNLYGGQIGIDALLYSNSWLHVESVLKGGAYWNDALSRQMYQSNTAGTTEVSAYDTPSPAAFVGELGFTGVLPLTSCLDFRFGYLVFWLQGIAQPTRQLSLPVSTTGDPLVLQDGGTVVQGLTLGLEGRW